MYRLSYNVLTSLCFFHHFFYAFVRSSPFAKLFGERSIHKSCHEKDASYYFIIKRSTATKQRNYVYPFRACNLYLCFRVDFAIMYFLGWRERLLYIFHLIYAQLFAVDITIQLFSIKL